jgi:hypothetical protein
MPLQHLKHYSRPSADGEGVDFDIESIAVDLITLAKATGCAEAQFFYNMHKIWPEVEVTVTPAYHISKGKH